MAIASHRIRSTSIEAQEFPELSGQYEVYAVPKIVVNDTHSFTGGLPEPQFVEAVLDGTASEGPTSEGGLL